VLREQPWEAAARSQACAQPYRASQSLRPPVHFAKMGFFERYGMGMDRGKDWGLPNRRILVTGGCGFIGSALVRHLAGCLGLEILNIDKLTYAGTTATVAPVAAMPNYRFAQFDICDAPKITQAIEAFQPDAIVHLAAESHVDRSIDEPAEFIRTNVLGTYTLLDAALRHYRSLPAGRRDAFRFVHISTDEVYGALTHHDAPFTEESQYRPNSPYSASKASSDHLARAWWRTYGLPVIISNCSNNYGPYQFPEKMVPTMILSSLHGRALPVYGAGDNVRDWLYVQDHVEALVCLLANGRAGETYAIGGGAELRNIDLVREICAVMDEMRPACPHVPHKKLISFVPDRPGHDLRYAIDSSKIRKEIGWLPKESFATGLRHTVRWYLENEDWWRGRVGDAIVGQRLGLMAAAAHPIAYPRDIQAAVRG
jgi:dTDP-glucose 4,6-dehydratase